MRFRYRLIDAEGTDLAPFISKAWGLEARRQLEARLKIADPLTKAAHFLRDRLEVFQAVVWQSSNERTDARVDAPSACGSRIRRPRQGLLAR